MSLDVGESEKCYQFLAGGVHCWQGPTAAFATGSIRPEAIGQPT